MNRFFMFLIVALAVSGCAFFSKNNDALDNCRNQLAISQEAIEIINVDLKQCLGDLDVSNDGFVDCINWADTLKETIATLEFEITNIKSTIKGNEDFYFVQLEEKADEINNIQYSLSKCEKNEQNLIKKNAFIKNAFDQIETLHNDLIARHFLINKIDVQDKLISVQLRIEAAEQAYYNLTTIEPPTPEVLEAIEVTKTNLNFDYGARDMIGECFKIQIETGQLNE